MNLLSKITFVCKFILANHLGGFNTPLRELGLSITTTCNLECKMCDIRRYEPSAVNIPLPLFSKLIRDAAALGLVQVTFSGGEPLLHPNFVEMIDICKKYGVRVSIFSNFSIKIGEKLWGAISNLDQLLISFDGATVETYEKIRHGAKFNQTISNIKEYKKRNPSKPLIFNYVVQRSNYHEIDKAVELFTLLGADTIDFEPVKQWGIKERLNVSNREFEIYRKKAELVQRKLETTGCSKIELPYFSQREGCPRCYVPWYSLYVTSRGMVYPCCALQTREQTPLRNDVMKKAVIGDLNREGIEEIWNSQKLALCRKQLLKDRSEFYPVCITCGNNLNKINIIYDKYLKYFT